LSKSAYARGREPAKHFCHEPDAGVGREGGSTPSAGWLPDARGFDRPFRCCLDGGGEREDNGLLGRSGAKAEVRPFSAGDDHEPSPVQRMGGVTTRQFERCGACSRRPFRVVELTTDERLDAENLGPTFGPTGPVAPWGGLAGSTRGAGLPEGGSLLSLVPRTIGRRGRCSSERADLTAPRIVLEGGSLPRPTAGEPFDDGRVSPGTEP